MSLSSRLKQVSSKDFILTSLFLLAFLLCLFESANSSLSSSLSMANGEESQSVMVKEELRGEEEQEEKWLKHYSSFHQILLVGEGDFSFSLCLAKAFGSASNIVASSLDSYDALIINYKQAKSNMENLEKLGASLLHGVDATKMKLHADLRTQKFDRIIFNFPHAGFYGKEDRFHLVMRHRILVYGFLRNARGMLRPNGEVHVNHKTTAPFCYWNIPELASMNSLTLIECVDFRMEDFPGYSNKRGAGSRCDEPFPLGECSTFKFVVSPTAVKMSKVRNWNSAHGRSQMLQVIPIHMQSQLASFDWQPPLDSPVCHGDMPEYTGLPLHIDIRNECFRIFVEYLNHARETFGRTDFDVSRSVHAALELGFERYMTEDSGRPSSGYIDILEELRQLSILRTKWLQNMLVVLDQHL